jgi:hypothetical protein
MAGYTRIFRTPRGVVIRQETDLSELTAHLQQMQDRVAHARPLMQRLADLQRESYSKTFRSGGRPAWAPLQPATIRAKARGGLPSRTAKGNVPRRLVQLGGFGPGNILIARGMLRDSYVQKGARGHVEEVTDESALVGSQLTEERPAAAPRLVTARKGKLTARAARKAGGGGIVRLAALHEEGCEQTHLPARPVAVVQDEDLEAAAEAARRFLAGEG